MPEASDAREWVEVDRLGRESRAHSLLVLATGAKELVDAEVQSVMLLF